MGKTRQLITLTMALVMCGLFLWLMPQAVYAAPAEGATVQYSGTSGTVTWEIYTDGTMVIRPTSGDEGTMASLNGDYNGAPWYSNVSAIKSVETQGTIHLGSNAAYMFYGTSNCTSMNLSGFDTSNVTNMYYMFYNSKATSLDLSEWDTSNVTNMGDMFSYSKATSLDLSRWDTSNVTNMGDMFSYSKATSLDLSRWDTSNVTNMSYMFSSSAVTSLDLSGWDTSNVTNMDHMFYNSVAVSLGDLSGWNTSKVTNMSGMFSNSAATSLDLSGWNTSSVTNMSYMFSSSKATSLGDLSRWDTSNITDMRYMFYGSAATSLGDLSGWDTSNVANMSYMFNSSAATSLDLSGWDTSNVTNMSGMFSYYKATSLGDLSGWNTSNVTDMSYMFYSSAATSIDVSDWNTSNVTNMDGMFYESEATNLDLSEWDTSNVTDMSSMFDGSDATSLGDLSEWNTSNVTNMSGMFSSSAVTSLDLSGWDTSNVTNMSSMFAGSKVQDITLGENFSFKGKNITSTSYQALLPTPPSDTTTSKWIKEDGTVAESKTPEELRDNYDANAAAWAGKWVWEVKTDSAVVVYNAQGGYTAQAQVNVSPISAVTIPTATRPAYYLTAWTTNADGTGTSYQPGDTFTPEGGKITTLYAQWAAMAQYKVNHYQQNTQQTGYDLVETENLYAIPNAQVSPEVKTYVGFISPQVQTVTVSDDNSTVVEYRYDRTTYTIHYDGNGADSGNVSDQPMVGGITKRLYDNKFKKTDAVFTGWNTKADGTGTAYGDVQTVTDLAGNGETVTLYARWLDISNASHEPTDGKYTVTLRPGQTATIPELPAGTRYRITEKDIPNGWSQSGTVGTDGSIVSNETQDATVTNSYSASGVISFNAYKTMTGGEAEEGAYEFKLYEGSTLLQTVRNGAPDTAEEILSSDGETTVKNPYYGMSVIRFEDIRIDSAGTHTFTIKETAGSDESVKYDGHTEIVTVNASDNGDGTLTCTAQYDVSGPVFTNEKIPVFDNPDLTGRLLIKKTVSNMASSQTFPFTVRLYDSQGTELTGEYKCDTVEKGSEDSYIDVKTVTMSAVSHTQNLNDLGEKQSNYGGSWTNNNIRGTGRDSAKNEAHVITIPGAEELEVTIVYGGESASYDWVCAWQGVHSNYTAASNHSSSFTGKLGGGSHTSASNTKTYTVPGDSVTFAYKSDGGGYGDGYGYYAVVTAQVKQNDYKDGFISTQKIRSGDTISITPSQTAVIRDLPEGVTYKVEEAVPAGYELVTSDGTEGSITGNADSTASFTNVYNGRGQAQIRMQKTFTGGSLTGGEFTFRLLDGDGETVEEVTNGADGSVVFSPLQFGSADIGQRYGYTVVEVPGNDDAILYDEHAENVIVSVSDGGDGNIVADVQYKGGAQFTNSPASSSLKVKKTVTGNMGDRTKQFPFSIALRNADRTPYAKEVHYTKGSDTGTLTPDAEGVISFTLAHGDEIVLEDLTYGAIYVVTETGAEADGYTVTKTNDMGSIAQENPDVIFTNTRGAEVPTGIPMGFGGAVVAAIAAVVVIFLVYRKNRR